MTKLFKTITTLGIFLLLCAGSIQAQNKGDIGLRLLGSLGTYGGDNDLNPDEGGFIDGITQKYLDDGGFVFGAELGYGLTNALSINLRGVYGEYPQIESPFDDPDNNRWTAALLLRYRFLHDKLVSPYVHLGANISEASSSEQIVIEGFEVRNGEVGDSFGVGPTVGIGLGFNISPRFGFSLDWTTNLVTPDLNLDASDPEVEADETDFDYLTNLGAGLYFTLKGDFCDPVDVLGIQGPGRVNINEAASYSGQTNMNADEPVEHFWDFGDGSTAMGMSGVHSFSQKGTYTVSYSASNCGGTDVETMMVTVVDPCDTNRPSITSSNASSSLEAGEAGSFSASASGTGVSYKWMFGDGTTANGMNVSHTYENAGTYTVTLEVMNECGTDTQTFRVTVTAPPDPCDSITELNTVYFDFRSTELDNTARSLLAENISILNDCPNICVNVNGYSDNVERSQRLSEQRARAVYDYYVDMGVDASRLTSTGLGAAQPPCAKEDPGTGCRRNRRAESIPMRCN